MQVVTIVMIIGFAILILWLILTEIHNHQIEVSNNRAKKRYRYQENIDIIPTYWKKYISTENFTGKFETLDDFAFVFKMTLTSPSGDISKINLQWPVITAEKEMMYEWFRHIKDTLDREVEPFLISRV